MDPKKTPRTILILWAAGRICQPLAKFLLSQDQNIQLRLVTSKAEKKTDFHQKWSSCEGIVADYYDVPSLQNAVEGMEGGFLVMTLSRSRVDPIHQ